MKHVCWTLIITNGSQAKKKPHTNGTSPGSRYGHTAVLAGPRIIIFGGKGPNEKVFKDIHALDPISLTWYQGPEGSGSPQARFGHSANLVLGSKMVVFGGSDGKEFFNDINVLHLDTMSWTKPEVKGSPPLPRYYHAAVVIKNTIMIQGGFSFAEELLEDKSKIGSVLQSFYLNDLRLLQTDKMEWVRLAVSGTPPLPRFGHTLNISGSSLVIFGGWSKESNLRVEDVSNDDNSVSYFKVLNVDNLVWESSSFRRKTPANRYGHTTTSIGSHLVIFGGWEFNRATNEVFILRNLESQ